MAARHHHKPGHVNSIPGSITHYCWSLNLKHANQKFSPICSGMGIFSHAWTIFTQPFVRPARPSHAGLRAQPSALHFTDPHLQSYTHTSNHIKFPDETTVLGLITRGDESTYREEMEQLSIWCTDNNLFLNLDKCKEIIVSLRKSHPVHTLLSINSSAVEIV